MPQDAVKHCSSRNFGRRRSGAKVEKIEEALMPTRKREQKNCFEKMREDE